MQPYEIITQNISDNKESIDEYSNISLLDYLRRQKKLSELHLLLVDLLIHCLKKILSEGKNQAKYLLLQQHFHSDTEKFPWEYSLE